MKNILKKIFSADDIIEIVEVKTDKQLEDATAEILKEVESSSSNWAFLPYSEGYTKSLAKDLKKLGYSVDVDPTALSVDLKPIYKKLYKGGK